MKKKLMLLIVSIAAVTHLTAQNIVAEKNNKWDFVKEIAVSAGLGIGGNSAFGAEMQLMFLPRLSAQLGAGINGFSGGVNFHIYPAVNSPYFSLQAWQQGFGNNYKAAYAGSMFVYRAQKLLQAGLGVGYRVDKNPNFQPVSNFILMFNLGIYIPML